MTMRYERHADLRLTALQGEGVVLHLGTRRYFTVSESGVDILEALAKPSSLDEIVERLMTVYDVTDDEARRTAQAFLDLGRRHGLITARDTP